ncbi:MAG: hypothetical protein KDE53_26120, partial [Caldilineaceae bacterium]|nr:hypothetical protein [Caldilineaceae bacterium]
MAEGSLVLNINQLQTAFAGIQTLLGAAPEGDGTGTGLAGAAHIAVDSPGNQVLSFAASFTGQVEGLFDLETASSLSAIGNLFGDLAVQVEASPTAELATFV